MANELPKRKNSRLKDHDYSSPGAYFITICTRDKKNVFWDRNHPDIVGEDIILPLSPYGKIAEKAIEAIHVHYSHIELQQYVIMPNHIHLILFIPCDSGRLIASPTSVATVIGQMKRFVSKKIGSPIWQRSFYDHIIRDQRDYDKIAKYIHDNPAKWQNDCFYSE